MPKVDKKRAIFLVLIIAVGFSIYWSWSVYNFSSSIYKAQNIVLKIDNTYIKSIKEKKEPKDEFLQIESWLNEKGETLFRLNQKDISTEFLILKKCWQSNSKAKKCNNYYLTIKESISSYISYIQKKLKRDFILFLISILVVVILSIKLIKEYIKQIIKENIIYDNESKLYSYYYCLDIAKKLCSQSDRTKRPISAIYIQLPQLKNYPPEERRKILENAGEYITSTIRLSDIACRYGNSSFLIFMPNISDINKIPVNRISEGLTKYIREFSPNCEVIVSSTIREFEEDYKEFIKRATKL